MVNVLKPQNLQDALNMLSQKRLMIYNGGTDLMIRYQATSGTLPRFLNDVLCIGNLEELRSIDIGPEWIKIGSAVTLSEILDHKDMPEMIKLPLREIGSLAIRNLGTIGGNICNASPAGDSLTMLYALEAEVVIASQDKGERRMSIGDFILGPKQNILHPDELLVRIDIPRSSMNHIYYRKVGARTANAISKLSFYGAAKQEGDILKDIRIAFGAVGPTVVRSKSNESELIRADRSERLEIGLKVYDPLITPIDDVRSSKTYRKKVALNLLKDFLDKEMSS